MESSWAKASCSRVAARWQRGAGLGFSVYRWCHGANVTHVPSKEGRSGCVSGHGMVTLGVLMLPVQEAPLERAELGWGQHFCFGHVKCETPL